MSLRLLSPQENKILQYIALPLIVLVFYVGLIYLYKFLGLPSSGEIINFAKRYYENYGYWVVLVGALVEGAFFIKLGWEGPLLKIQAKVKDQGLRALFTAYVHPNFGALAATAAGILRLY